MMLRLALASVLLVVGLGGVTAILVALNDRPWGGFGPGQTLRRAVATACLCFAAAAGLGWLLSELL